jgi:general secretion pathway protein C
MNRWAVLVSFLLFLALCASVAAWAVQLFKPASRPLAAAAVPTAVPPTADLRAASTLFGGRQTGVTAATYALKGVVVARRPSDSAAIMAAGGNPAQAVPVGAEVVPGVTVKEVHSQFVLLSEGGREKRVELPELPPPLNEVIPPGEGQPGATPTGATRPAEKPSPAGEAAATAEGRPRANRRANALNPGARSGSD